jgi:hypothetical protein
MIDRLERMMVKLVKVESLCNIYMAIVIVVMAVWIRVRILLDY